MAGSSLVGNLAVSLNLETAAFTKGSKKAQTEATRLQKTMGGIGNALKGFGAGLVAGFGVDTITSAIGRGLDYASSLGEVAQQLGVTTDALQTYRYAATQTGIDQGTMDAALAKLTRTIGEARAGSEPLVAAFGKLGLSMQDIAGKDTGQVMAMVADGLNRIQDPAQRAAVAVDLMGKSAQKLTPLLSEGSAGMNAYAKAARDMGIVLTEEQIAKADAAADKMTALKTVLEMKIAGAVADNTSTIMQLADAMAHMSTKALEGVGSLSKLTEQVRGGSWKAAWETAKGPVLSFIVTVADKFAGLPHTVAGHIIEMNRRVYSALRTGLGQAADWAGKKVDELNRKFWQLKDDVVGHSYIPDMVDGIAREMARLQSVMVDPAVKAADETANAMKAAAERIHSLLQRLFPEIEQAKTELQELADIRSLPGDLQGEARSRWFTEKTGIGVGDLEPMGEDPRDITDRFEEQASRFSETLGELGRNTKLKGGELALSLAYAAEGIVGAIQGMVSAFKNGGTFDKIMGVLGVVQAGVQAYMGMKGGGQFGGMMSFGGFRAMGGPTVPGKSYIVGENGPEWFTPGRSGYVHPSNDNSRGSIAQIVPSPYFDVVVDGRVVKRATPMISGASVATVGETQRVMSRRHRQQLP